MTPALARFLPAAGAAGLTRVLVAAAPVLPAAARDALARVNHRGEPVSLVEGPAVALAATAGAAAGAALTGRSARLAMGAVVAGLGAGVVGLYDDVVGARPSQRRDKGFAGHLRALREGRVSSGAVKVAGIGVAGLAAAWCLPPPGVRSAERRRRPVGTFGAARDERHGGILDATVDGVLAAGVVAGTANLVNLLDLRPGRALKAAVLLGIPLVAGPGGGIAAGTLGAAAAALPEDLGERTMLGDAGANAVGALLGLGIAASAGRMGRAAVLGVLVALTLASERVSFTAVIARTPVLRELDALGRGTGGVAPAPAGTAAAEPAPAERDSVPRPPR